MNGTPSTARTLLVAAGVALACSLMVSTAVYVLRPIQLAYAELATNRVILTAAGLIEPSAELSDREVVDRFLQLDTRVVDLDEGRFARGIDPYEVDSFQETDDGEAIPGGRDTAGLDEGPRYANVYLLMRDDRIDRIVLPVYGSGMWSTIYGYLCLESDFSTIAGIEFYQHGETPGIGDRILNPAWREGWQGKRAYDDAGELRFRIGGEGVADAHRVDAISGATMTVNGVENLVRYWLGNYGFGPLLERLREQED